MRLLLDTNALVRGHIVKLRPADDRTLPLAELLPVRALRARENAVQRAPGQLDLKDTVAASVTRYGLPETTVTWCRVEREGRVACLAARVRHPDPVSEFRVRVRQWAGPRGWGVTVAPCGTAC